MDMTLRQYLSNPQGKGSVASAAVAWRSEYDPRYENLLATHGKFDYYTFRQMNGRVYFIVVDIPSETYDKVVYQAVFKFDSKGKSALPMKDWDVRAISNSPSFVFTYENVFKRNKILVEELKDLLPDESYNEKPKVRNPYGIVGYEKTLYYAARYLTSKIVTLSELDKDANRIDLKAIRSRFGDFSKVMATIETEQKKKVAQNKKDREDEKRARKNDSNSLYGEQKMENRVKSIDRSPKSNRITPNKTIGKKSNRIKSIKKL